MVQALGDKDLKISQNADRVLRSLKNQAARDVLINLELDGKNDHGIIALINAAGYRHSDEGRWFIYLALVGRFDEYLAEDFEFKQLRVEFRAAPATLQARIRETILEAGETRMNPLFVPDRRETLLTDLTEEDADLLVKVNVRNRNWEDLFRYLYVLPARHILAAVKSLGQAGWRPADPDRGALYDRLLALVPEIGEPPDVGRAGIPMNPVFQKRFGEGESGALASMPQSDLRGKLTENVSPPEQVASLGALLKSGNLSDADLDTAARSPHWLVRMAAATLRGPIYHVNDGGKVWFDRFALLFDAEAVWGEKPCRVSRDGLDALQEGLRNLPQKKAAGGLWLVEAVAAHYMAHDIEREN